ncbi:MAG: M10 family metallopeptidase C-terminal domain-containing protein (plasmid) [Dolichospermum sp. DET50]|nr:M10 family metallopeptidase C-terminal domain-containing protein [Dolichospermum sp. DET66]MBS3035987.1 M10 family metallopeptidase C-terminal domain-containing protein [Dolichospermum sp. DET67]MBS3041155.1 M10 family metallopeptidase C-terminal domain-containing protein [Dolichospermum sp. DET50]QSX70895.1 MAG: M10 family metallopeptidase C-terminal domain-containing protein [Dolichospermum sp. DET69]
MAHTILTVTTTADQNDGNDKDLNNLSLRDAILIANANPTTDYEIHLTGGTTYNLTSNGINEDAALKGDLDIKSRSNVLYIVAVGGQATINASGLLNSDRVFQVLDGGQLSLQNVMVTGGNISSDGGGIRVDSNAALDLYNSTVTGNKASGFSNSGGGIYNSGFVYLRNGSIVSNNIAAGDSSQEGGGIYNSGGTLIATNSTISNNEGGVYGGGISTVSGSVTLINTTVSGNSAGNGGGIRSNGTSVTLLNTTISGNSARNGGGIYASTNGVFNLINSTVTKNTAISTEYGDGGGGIYSLSATVNLKNTIVAGNINSNAPDLLSSFLSSALFNGNNNNLIGSLAGAKGTVGTGTDIVNPNPGLRPLQNNGGLTLTHALLPGSPAINAGNNNLIPADTEDLDGDGNRTEPIPYDQRGLTRLVGGGVDIGAFEVQAAALPSLSIKDITVTEGNTGTKNATFTVTLSAASTSVVTVNYATANGTATAGSDYTATTGALTFNPGDTSKILNVAVTGDMTIESNETFLVNLSNATNATIADNQGVGTITNDDTLPTLSINDITVVEGQTPQAVLTITLSSASSQPVTVQYATAPVTATANADYTSSSGTLTFAANTTTGTITIPILNDSLSEANETFKVNLSSPTNATLQKSSGTVTITDTLQASTTTTLADGIENLTLTGTSNINGTGNSGNNILTGNSGNNILAGGSGNDTYAFNASTPLGSDTIQEISTGGNDTISFSGTTTDVRLNLGVITTQTVNSNLKLTLSANNVIENIVTGSGNDRLIGNSLNNNLNGGSGNDVLTGRSGADILTGGAGNDILSGGSESDRFWYSSGRVFTSSDFGVDTLTDFTSASDKLVLSKQTFTALSSVVGDGLSQVSDFTTVEDDDLAATSTAYLVYSIGSGSLYYNQNGSAAGFGTGAEFANLINLPSVTTADFAIVA